MVLRLLVGSNGIVQVNPSQVFTELGMGTMTEMASSMSAMSEMGGSVDAWSRLTDNTELLEAQYDVLAGRLPAAWNEAVIVADQDGRVSDYTLYTLGLLDTDDLRTMLDTIMEGGEVTSEPVSYTYDELLSLSFKLLKQTDYYQQTESGWQDMREDAVFMEQALAEAEEIKIVGVLKVSEDAVSSTNARRGFVGYRSDLMEHLVEEVNASAIVAAQQADPETDVFTGKPFRGTDSAEEQPFDPSTLSAEQQRPRWTVSRPIRA